MTDIIHAFVCPVHGPVSWYVDEVPWPLTPTRCYMVLDGGQLCFEALTHRVYERREQGDR